MKKRMVRLIGVWFLFCTVGLVSCGHGGGASKALQVQLQIPTSTTAANFWLGVDKKTLTIRSGGGEALGSFAWNESLDIDLHQGDVVSFEGRDTSDQLLVYGEATVDKENTLLLPVKRVL